MANPVKCMKRKTLQIHCGWLSLWVTAGLSGLAGQTWAQDKASAAEVKADQQEPIVFCPAITHAEQRRPYYMEEPVLPVDLVVFGTSKEIEGKDGQRQYEVDVQRVLYGSVSGRSLRFLYSWKAAETEPTIFALASADYDEDYQLVLRMSGDELKFQEQLSMARLDFNVLTSSCIFIGKQAEPGRTFLNSVEVVRSLHGPVLTPGERLTVYSLSKIGTPDYLPPPQDKELIYLIHSIAPGKEVRWTPKDFADKTVYQLNTRLRTDQEQAVKEAWERRDEYPVSRVESEGRQVPVREIVLRGPTAGAIEMIGALGYRSSDAAVLLAQRTLLARKPESISEVVAAIERDLIRQTPEDARTFVRLQRLVMLLAELGENRPDGETGRLIEKWLTAIPTGPAMQPWPKRDPHKSQPEEKQTDVNHALTWLVESMDRKTLDDEFCARLLKARDSLQGGWGQEVQLALDVTGIEDTLELMESLSRPKKGTPLSIPKSFLPKATGQASAARVTGLCFSANGQMLCSSATDGTVCRWNAVTGQMESRILVPEGYHEISSSKDGRYVVCYESKVMAKASAEGKGLAHAAKIVDVTTGAVVSEPLLPVGQNGTRILWVDEHRAIASATYACLFDCQTGTIIQTFKKAVYGHLTEDGKNSFIIKGADRMPWASESMTLTRANLPTGEVTKLGTHPLKSPTGSRSGLVPGGRYFYIGHPGMFIYDRQSLELVAEKSFKGSTMLRTVFSPDGSRYAVLTSGRSFFNRQFPDHDPEKHGIIRLHDTLSGKLLWSALTPSRGMRDPVFSPDGKRLASVAEEGTIVVWDLEE